MTLDDLLNIEEIKQLRLLYSDYFDRNQVDELVDLFTDDAVCEFPPEAGGIWSGKDVIRHHFSQIAGSYGSGIARLLVVTNPLIRLIDGDTANGRWYLTRLVTALASPVSMLGIYEDVYKKRNGAWKIQHTRLELLWPKQFRVPGLGKRAQG